jgi:hypothetical protein
MQDEQLTNMIVAYIVISFDKQTFTMWLSWININVNIRWCNAMLFFDTLYSMSHLFLNTSWLSRRVNIHKCLIKLIQERICRKFLFVRRRTIYFSVHWRNIRISCTTIGSRIRTYFINEQSRKQYIYVVFNETREDYRIIQHELESETESTLLPSSYLTVRQTMWLFWLSLYTDKISRILIFVLWLK